MHDLEKCISISKVKKRNVVTKSIMTDFLKLAHVRSWFKTHQTYQSNRYDMSNRSVCDLQGEP